jgi:hypothetical protein
MGDVTHPSAWRRLHDIADARRRHLGLTVKGLREAGAPSEPWFHKLKDVTGPVSARQVRWLEQLDQGLRWPVGTSRNLIEGDRSGWSEFELESEAHELVVREDRVGHFAFAVAGSPYF